VITLLSDEHDLERDMVWLHAQPLTVMLAFLACGFLLTSHHTVSGLHDLLHPRALIHALLETPLLVITTCLLAKLVRCYTLRQFRWLNRHMLIHGAWIAWSSTSGPGVGCPSTLFCVLRSSLGPRARVTVDTSHSLLKLAGCSRRSFHIAVHLNLYADADAPR
jgi:hypothetical protein